MNSIIDGRRKNGEYFKEVMGSLTSINIQRETGESSWFGFSLIVSDAAAYSRQDLLTALNEENIEYRPIVTGNFLKNTELLKYFDYEVAGDVLGAERIERQGLFVGNHHYDLSDQIDLLSLVINKLENNNRSKD